MTDADTAPEGGSHAEDILELRLLTAGETTVPADLSWGDLPQGL
ncbi:hypothetical protein [Pseudarthrobacter sp. S9]